MQNLWHLYSSTFENKEPQQASCIGLSLKGAQFGNLLCITTSSRTVTASQISLQTGIHHPRLKELIARTSTLQQLRCTLFPNPQEKFCQKLHCSKNTSDFLQSYDLTVITVRSYDRKKPNSRLGQRAKQPFTFYYHYPPTHK